MIRSLVTNMVMMINAHVDKSGISDVYSPRELVLRWQLDWTKHCRAPFGVYCIAYDDPTITNTQEERATEAICLGLTGNFNGTYKFLSLKTGKIIKRRKFDVIPTPDSVIRKINSWGRRDQSNGRLVFRDRNNNPYDWEEEHDILIEDNAVEQEPEPAPYPDIPAEIPGVELERDQPAITPDPEPTEEDAMDAAAQNAGFGRIEERLVENAGVELDGARHNRVIEIDLDVISAEGDEIMEPEESGDETDETYHPEVDDDGDDENELIPHLNNPALDEDYESSDDEEED